MPIWIVKASWIEDEAEVNERWEVNAPTPHDAVQVTTAHIHFQPTYVEVRSRDPDGDEKSRTIDLPSGHFRRIPPE
jgi:hypothetical protein